MDFISARLTKLSTQRAIRGFVALLVTSATFWCLISGDDALQNSSTHHSDGVNLVPRRTVKIQTPGAIAGLVVGTILGVLAAIGVIVWLVYHVNRKVNRYSGRHVETRWPSARDSSTASVTINNIYPCNIYPRNLTGKFYTGEIRLRGVLSDLFDRTPPFGETDSATNSGPPKQFWRPTEQERDLASRISLDGSPSLAIPTAAKQAPPEGSEYDPVFKLSSPDLERTAILAPLDSSDVAIVLPTLAHLANHHTSPQPSLSSQALPERLSFDSTKRSHEDDEVAATSSQFPCREPSCSRTFSKQYKLNHHMRYHAKSKQCPTCSKSFGTVTHLERHVNSAHSSTKRYHCNVEACKYSKTVGGDAVFFSRKDNWRRHMKDSHGLT